MIRSISRASQLALRCSTQRPSSTPPSLRPTTQFCKGLYTSPQLNDLPSSRTPLGRFQYRQTRRSRTPTPLSRHLRFCSTHRMMCKKGEISGATPLPDREVLPTNVKPLYYDLILEPNFETFKYNGTVIIELVKKASCQWAPPSTLA